MKRAFLTLVAVVAFSASAAGGVSASQDDLGTPGEPNCEGQTVALVAQLNQEVEGAKPGFGNRVRDFGLTNQEGMDVVEAFCASAAP